jgi:hypothetical protein
MSAQIDTDTDVEAILDDLYTNEINTALSWSGDRGFRAALGTPTLAWECFRTSGESVNWLKQQALDHFRYRRPVFARTNKCSGNDGQIILDALCESNINGSISWVRDSGFYASLDDPQQGEGCAFPTIGEAIAWLRDQACIRYPASEFTREYYGFV